MIEPPPPRLASRLDREAHRPLYVVWEITLACDLKCTHCGSRAGRPRPRELSTAECLEVVAALARLGTQEITLIGGEAYLRRDWVDIVGAIRAAGMHCGLQTGGRTLTDARLEPAIAAGLQVLSVSLDGDAAINDGVRGVPGAFAAGIDALRRAAGHGLWTAVNTQLSPPAIDRLDAMLPTLADAGVQAWRIGQMVPMGRAADQPELLLQPRDLLDLMPRLAALAGRAALYGVDLQIDNSLGYFGPHEATLRSSDPSLHWHSCGAGRAVMGIESDGLIKGCPSLPSEAFGGGRVTELSLEAIWADAPEIRLTRDAGVTPRGFCATCYYAPVCRGGCSWMAHALLGQPGDNPYCHHRALELRRQGLEERVIRVTAPPGTPYDVGRFAIEVGGPSIDQTPRPAGVDADTPLHPCPACGRHVYAVEASCPHCGVDLEVAAMSQAEAGRALAAAGARLGAALRDLVNG